MDLNNNYITNLLPDKLYLSLLFRRRMGYWMDWRNPQTFNEKLQWLKVYDRRDDYTMMVDKYTVKEYVSNIIGREYIIPTLGVWDKFDDIDFSKLPNQFVLKCTHDSGGLVICKDITQFNFFSAKKKLNAALKTNFYNKYREWPYKNVKPRIIAEEYVEDKNGGTEDLMDYKFMCYNGKCQNVFVCSNRQKYDLRVDFFDLNWKHLPFKRMYQNSDSLISCPDRFEEMVVLSEKIANAINNSFVRIDFYNVNHCILFGEITFYPGTGLEPFTPVEWDYNFGNLVSLEQKK